MATADAIPTERSAVASSGRRLGVPELEKVSRARLAISVLLVAAGYYVGANIGLILRFPPQTPSVLWPPNAILTATLLLAPTQRWWIYLLAALPAHLLATAGTGWSLPLVLPLFATNCSEALLAATAVRRWSDNPTRFDTLRRVLVFVAGAGLVAPFVSSFLDAGVVAGLRIEPYWQVWRTRVFANVLTELTVPPAIILSVTSGWPWIRQATRARELEMLLLVGALVTASAAVVGGPAGGWVPMSDLPHVPVALFLPIIFWAAVRFRPGGVSWVTLATTLLLSWSATHARGPFTTLTPAEGVLALQSYMIVSVVPFMCLAGLIEERRRAERALADRLRFEEFLSRLSSSFIHLPSVRMNEAFDTWLQRIGVFLTLDRVLLFRFGADAVDLGLALGWQAPSLGRLPAINVIEEYPWTVTLLRKEEPVVIERLEDMPMHAVRDRESLRRDGVRSKLVLPLLAGSRVLGGLALVMATAERAWPGEEVARLQLVAEVFGNALARKESEDALRENEGMKAAILDSLDSGIAVLNRQGALIALNRAWTRSAPEWTALGIEVAGGTNYLNLCEEAARHGETHAADLLAGILSVLGGSRPLFRFECAATTPAGERWLALTVAALGRPEGGVIVSSTDVTERKRAEMEVQRSREELAHFTRVSAMGELTASIAHELNQPLAGILANAEAARQFLNLTPPPLHEVQSILADIVEDDLRAADVIKRLRELLRKGKTEMTLVDLHVVVLDVVRLLGSDFIIREVRLRLDLDAAAAVVKGDRVQLQQVVLNLLLNAMDAMTDAGPGDRTLVVRTRSVDERVVRLSVEDNGPGFRPGAQSLVFEPFYTTKPGGMGMGLAITRSIVAAHGGSITAEGNRPQGAIFHVALPLAEATT
jgi:signal transduction histidine kinase